jgi:hypothetical protein
LLRLAASQRSCRAARRPGDLERGEAADLAALAPELDFALLVPLLGPLAAGEEAARLVAGVAR